MTRSKSCLRYGDGMGRFNGFDICSMLCKDVAKEQDWIRGRGNQRGNINLFNRRRVCLVRGESRMNLGTKRRRGEGLNSSAFTFSTTKVKALLRLVSWPLIVTTSLGSLTGGSST